jgi:ribosomal protein L37AE/L43A
VITALNADEQREIAARRHRCALCGEAKQLTHKKISGGVPTFICNKCAEDYVQRAQRVQARQESPKKLMIEVSARELATVTVNGIAVDLIRLVEEYLEEEGFADDADIRLIRSEET